MPSLNQFAQQPSRLVYDAECQLCVSVKLEIEQARAGLVGDRLQFVAYQSEEAKKVLGQDYRQGRPETALLGRPSGEVLQGIEAFLPLLPSLRGGEVAAVDVTATIRGAAGGTRLSDH